MQRNIEELTIELIRLPKRKRLEVVRFLLFLDNEQSTANDVDLDWRQEITNRIHAVENGTAIGVDYDNAVKKYYTALNIMKKILLQQAHQELISAVEYYEEQGRRSD